MEQEEYEVFLNAGSDSLQDIVCPPLSNQKTNAQRHWALLRNMAHANYVMKRSLTKEEKDLLDCMDASDSRPTPTNCEKRKSLYVSLSVHSSSLHDDELAYLKKLADSPHVPVEIVEKAARAIEMNAMLDAIPSPEEHLINREDDRSRLMTQRQRDASFRKELWTLKEDDHNSTVEEKDSSSSSFLSFFESQADEKAVDDDPILQYSILGTSVGDHDCDPHVLTPPLMEALRPHLPYSIRFDNFWLKYSMMRDGSSMWSLLPKLRNSSRTILAIETMEGDVLGAFVSSPWKARGLNYYGSGEAFLWRMKQSRFTPCVSVQDQVKLESTVEIFPWSGENRNVQRLERNDSNLILGGGGPEDDPTREDQDCGSGLVLLPCLTRGYSNPCLTFKSPSLPPSEDEMFEIANMEVWTLTPVDTVEQADKVEMGRRFIFDHGNFVEY